MPFLKRNLALAYVPVEEAALDNVVAVEIRGQAVKAKVVPVAVLQASKEDGLGFHGELIRALCEGARLKS